MECCLEGWRQWTFGRWWSVNLYGDDSAVYTDRKQLVQLVDDLESIQESRVASDQCILSDLIRKYESKKYVRAQSLAVEGLPEVEDREYKMLPLPSSTKRPILEGTTASELLQHLKEEFDVPLHPHFVMKILELSTSLHRKRIQRYGPILPMSLPGPGGAVQLRTGDELPEPRIVVLGDTHGQLGDVLWAISEFGLPSEKNAYLVNGDVADRCDWSCEIFMLLLTVMLQYPNDLVVVLNRGNHECLAVNGSRCGGFQRELLDKYGAIWGPYLHALFGELYAELPLAVLVQDTVLVVHGGLSRNPERQLTHLKDATREPTVNPWGMEGDAAMDALVDTLWADPSDAAGSFKNPRGCSHLWGPDYTRRFLKASGLQLIIRSHQVPEDQSGVYVHHSHDDKVITVFTASNHRGRHNRAGAVLLAPGANGLDVACRDLGICPSWRVLSRSRRLRRRGVAAGDEELVTDLLQQAMGLLAEWRLPLWEACVREDPQLSGVLSLSRWRRLCRDVTATKLDWVLLARLVGGASRNHLRYMETLNRFSFKIASQVVESELASGVLCSMYLQMMHADDSLQHLLGRLCRPGAKAQELLETFDELLRRNAVGAAERRAVRRSLEAQGRHLDVAEFLSAWKCAAGVRVKLEKRQADLACQISRLLGSRSCRARLSSLPAASADTLMGFFNLADVDGDGYLSIEEGYEALCTHLRKVTRQELSAAVAEDLRDLLRAADSTGSQKLNYLEFLSLFDFGDPKGLTHQAVLDLFCFQVWAHRNALSGLFRYIGSNGRITKQQLRWSLTALSELQGGLEQAHVEQIVEAVKFSEDSVSSEELLDAFQLVDKAV